MLDSLALLIVGIYLLAVAIKGNAKGLIAEVKQDKAVIPWLISAGVLLYLLKIPELHDIAVFLIIWVIFVIYTGPSGIATSIADFWHEIGG